MLPAAWAWLCAAPAWAQETGGSRAQSLTTQIDASVSYNMDSRRGGVEHGDWVTELRPGLRWDARSGRVVGSVQYSLGLNHHSKEYSGENVQNQLSANLSAEAIDRWMYVDASANVSQQARSAFGTQTVAGSQQDNANRVEVGNFFLSPYVRGIFGSAVSYEARLTASATNARRSKEGDSTAVGGALTVSSVAGGNIGWAITGSRTKLDYRIGRETVNDRYSASLQFLFDADFIAVLRGGQEATDVADVQRRTYDNWGAGLTWRPDPRTRVQGDYDERYFGRSYRVLVDHRMARSSVQFNSSRDVVGGGDPNNTNVRITLYDLFYAQAASEFPDPVVRDAFVRAFLRANGLDPNTTVAGGFLNTAVTVQERHQLALSYSGLRFSTSLQAFSSSSKVVEASTSALPQEDTRQWGYVGTAAYRLSPTQSVSLTGSRLLTRATPTRPGSELKSAGLSYLEQFGRRTAISFGARYSVFNSALDPYREAAVSASLSQRF